jgi:DNA-binding HxlR family transcriptional regulator
MSSPFLALLTQIAGGVVIFEPFRRDTQGLLEYQDLVHRLQEMERLGLVGRLYVQTRASHSTEYIDLVMVQGGLTEEGKRLLAEQEQRSASG